ncbi:hypothetical protein CXG81DRAFT_21005 [Caulochytrium protostelioides]|uniref:Cullin family profile domain-containing protein n=1 Tax=Caulochytrium protostelioides TaxID=1555241 RepID=A0A4P9X2K5_9FUNG|nr:hypothetical protein CXG81DRAFT_21005 [Caulochytrium protostelioides]|eukprot:RKO98840.1 hypothetical protein CXG81DRAFT_21005 [Caulochytrium protostelioides]
MERCAQITVTLMRWSQNARERYRREDGRDGRDRQNVEIAAPAGGVAIDGPASFISLDADAAAHRRPVAAAWCLDARPHFKSRSRGVGIGVGHGVGHQGSAARANSAHRQLSLAATRGELRQRRLRDRFLAVVASLPALLLIAAAPTRGRLTDRPTPTTGRHPPPPRATTRARPPPPPPPRLGAQGLGVRPSAHVAGDPCFAAQADHRATPAAAARHHASPTAAAAAAAAARRTPLPRGRRGRGRRRRLSSTDIESGFTLAAAAAVAVAAATPLPRHAPLPALATPPARRERPIRDAARWGATPPAPRRDDPFRDPAASARRPRDALANAAADAADTANDADSDSGAAAVIAAAAQTARARAAVARACAALDAAPEAAWLRSAAASAADAADATYPQLAQRAAQPCPIAGAAAGRTLGACVRAALTRFTDVLWASAADEPPLMAADATHVWLPHDMAALWLVGLYDWDQQDQRARHDDGGSGDTRLGPRADPIRDPASHDDAPLSQAAAAMPPPPATMPPTHWAIRLAALHRHTWLSAALRAYLYLKLDAAMAVASPATALAICAADVVPEAFAQWRRLATFALAALPASDAASLSLSPSLPSPRVVPHGYRGIVDPPRLLHYAQQACVSHAVEALFDTIKAADAPDTSPALRFLQQRLQTLAVLPGYLERVLVGALRRRILHVGVPTSTLLDYFVLLMKALQALDPSGTLLEHVSRPIQTYLRGRSDAVEGVVALFCAGDVDIAGDPDAEADAEADSDGDLAMHAAAGPTASAALRWRPDAVTSNPFISSRQRRSKDIVSRLLEIQPSQEALIAAFQRSLATRFFQAMRFDEHDLVTVELLKQRLGDAPLNPVDVMIRDAAASARWDASVHARLASSPSAADAADATDADAPPRVSAVALSRVYWPDLGADALAVPTAVQAPLARYAAQWALLQPGRQLVWLAGVGRVRVRVDLAAHRDRHGRPVPAAAWEGAVAPAEAAVLAWVGGRADPGAPPVTAADAAAACGCDAAAAGRALLAWTARGVLVHRGPHYWAADAAPSPRPASARAAPALSPSARASPRRAAP